MNDETLVHLSTYLGHIADAMGLKDWTFDVSAGELDTDSGNTYAEVSVPDGRHHAEIKFSANFHEEPTAVIRDTVVHELIHCHLSLVEELAEHANVALGYAGSMWREGFSAATEQAVEAIAVAWARRLPEIGWPEAELRTFVRDCDE